MEGVDASEITVAPAAGRNADCANSNDLASTSNSNGLAPTPFRASGNAQTTNGGTPTCLLPSSVPTPTVHEGPDMPFSAWSLPPGPDRTGALGAPEESPTMLMRFFGREEDIIMSAFDSKQLHPLINSNKGVIAEALVANFLTRHLPLSYAVIKSFSLLDSMGQLSSELDIAVIDPKAPRFPFDAAGSFHVVPYDTVMAIIEVKAQSSRDLFRKSMDQMRALDNLKFSVSARRTPIRIVIFLCEGETQLENVTINDFDHVDVIGIIGKGIAMKKEDVKMASLPRAHQKPSKEPPSEVLFQLGHGTCLSYLSAILCQLPASAPLDWSWYTDGGTFPETKETQQQRSIEGKFATLLVKDPNQANSLLESLQAMIADAKRKETESASLTQSLGISGMFSHS